MVERAAAPMAFTEAEMAEAPADRVFLANYVRDVEIGAYPEERGVTQPLRFDVTLEVARAAAHIDDSVGRVLNYDDLVAAIEALIAGPRINLLETFAERLAHRCLVDPRARRVQIRIEKLGRLPGGATLGVEIVRSRMAEPGDTVRPFAPDAKG